MAAGFLIGTCVIWDCQTKKITSVLRDKHHTAPTTSICWSKNDRLVLVSDIEKSLILWDAMSCSIVARSKLRNIPMQVHLHPGSDTPTVCLVCPLSSPPLIVDLKTGSITVLPITLPDGKKKSDGFISVIPTAACFNKHGDLVYVGNYKGDILIIDHESINVRAIIPGSAMIKNIEFSRNGKYFSTNSTDGIIRIYKNLLPSKDALLALNDATRGLGAKRYEAKNLKVIGPKCLDLFQEISITTMLWRETCVSHDGLWVAGVSSCRDYEICVWDKSGRLVEIIDGPKEMLINIVWHPIYPLLVALSKSGSVYTWRNDTALESTKRDDELDSAPKIEIRSQYYGLFSFSFCFVLYFFSKSLIHQLHCELVHN